VGKSIARNIQIMALSMFVWHAGNQESLKKNVMVGTLNHGTNPFIRSDKSLDNNNFKKGLS
jgi:hypothetical protein